ncbi:hypothetical protein [Chromobacterium haemolyticum]|uniref:hypothetical protein n=1 Tax=Chromobacterium haemolyticum TaxID=394935 RepID=UPI00307F9BC0
MLTLTPINEPMCFCIRPVNVNQDGSISATVSLGVVRETAPATEGQPASRTFVTFAQQSHFITPEEAVTVLATRPDEGESLNDALSRAVYTALKAKGLIQF